MESCMSWENLSKEENTKVSEIMQKHNIKEFNSYICFHTRSEKISIDGELTDQELRCLSEISEYLGFRYQGQDH